MLLTQIVAALRREGDAHVLDDAPQNWTQGRTLFGGLQAALLVRAMRSQFEPTLPLRTLQTTFVGPVVARRIRIHARLLRTGKSAVHVDAQIVDGSQVLCTALAVFGRGRASALRILSSPPVVARTPDESAHIPKIPGISPAFTNYVDQRWASGGFPYTGAAEPRTQIYVRYADEAVVDESLIIAMADTIPSPAISMLKTPAPASSLSWTLELLAARWPTTGSDWWLMDAEASAAGEGYVFQTATLWSPDRQAIALSRQSAVVYG